MCDFSITVTGNTVTVNLPELSLQERYNLFREAIMDGTVPLWMPIGVALSTLTTASGRSVVERNGSCLTSVISIMNNVTNLLFTGKIAKNLVSTRAVKGTAISGEVDWLSAGLNSCSPVEKDRFLFSSNSPMSLRLFMYRGEGHRSMAENSRVIGDAMFTPLYTTHSLIDHVRVLPLTKDKIEVRYINGMTPELLQQIWDEGLNS